MNMVPLTAKQKKLKDFIRSYTREHGYSPSFSEMAAHLGIASKSSAVGVVDRLVERGHARRTGNKARSIELIEIEQTRAVLLSGEVHRLLNAYAAAERMPLDTAANVLLSKGLGVE